jgi:tRNA threonylcarbamoyl adenosine modification protein (Sua5/YciO/YrdC/YwlC family)
MDVLRSAGAVSVTAAREICANIGKEQLSPEIVRINQENPEPNLVAYVADQLQKGEVLAMPTDTFYGLAADPLNLRAVDRVYEIKSRLRHKPLSLLISSVEHAESLARDLLPEFYMLTERFWPGPLTLIVHAAPRLPLRVTANSGHVALRVPAAQIPLAVIRKAGVPITATSANLSGAAECTTAQAVREQLGPRLNMIVDGGTSPRSVPSTIVDLTVDELGKACWRVQREGAIPVHEIEAVLNAR